MGRTPEIQASDVWATSENSSDSLRRGAGSKGAWAPNEVMALLHARAAGMATERGISAGIGDVPSQISPIRHQRVVPALDSLHPSPPFADSRLVDCMTAGRSPGKALSGKIVSAYLSAPAKPMSPSASTRTPAVTLKPIKRYRTSSPFPALLALPCPERPFRKPHLDLIKGGLSLAALQSIKG
jgi:hypothetical protein